MKSSPASEIWEVRWLARTGATWNHTMPKKAVFYRQWEMEAFVKDMEAALKRNNAPITNKVNIHKTRTQWSVK